MAFFRFNRDKRGYEHFFLVEPVTNRRGKTRTRVLYWYRTPPNVKVGRLPFDEDVQRALEAQNPTVVFDWNKILNAPIPSAEAEKWRDRRRAEKAEKVARQQAATARAAEEPAALPREESASPEPVQPAASRSGLGTPGQPYRVTADQIRKRRRRRRGRAPTAEGTETAAMPSASAGDAGTPPIQNHQSENAPPTSAAADESSPSGDAVTPDPSGE